MAEHEVDDPNAGPTPVAGRCNPVAVSEIANRFVREVHRIRLRQTPFGQYLDMPNVKQDNVVVEELLSCHVGGLRFNLCDNIVEVTKEDVACILGLPLGGRALDWEGMVAKPLDGLRFYRRHFSGKSDFTRPRIVEILARLSEEPGELNEEDFVRFFVVFIFSTLLFPRSNYTCPVELLHLAEDVDALREYDWALAVHTHLEKEVIEAQQRWTTIVKQSERALTYVSACTVILAVWFYEITGSRKAGGDVNAIPRIRRWANTPLYRFKKFLDHGYSLSRTSIHYSEEEVFSFIAPRVLGASIAAINATTADSAGTSPIDVEVHAFAVEPTAEPSAQPTPKSSAERTPSPTAQPTPDSLSHVSQIFASRGDAGPELEPSGRQIQNDPPPKRTGMATRWWRKGMAARKRAAMPAPTPSNAPLVTSGHANEINEIRNMLLKMSLSLLDKEERLRNLGVAHDKLQLELVKTNASLARVEAEIAGLRKQVIVPVVGTGAGTGSEIFLEFLSSVHKRKRSDIEATAGQKKKQANQQKQKQLVELEQKKKHVKAVRYPTRRNNRCKLKSKVVAQVPVMMPVEVTCLAAMQVEAPDYSRTAQTAAPHID